MLDPDLDEYLSEYRLQAPAEPISHYEGKRFGQIFAYTKKKKKNMLIHFQHIIVLPHLCIFN